MGRTLFLIPFVPFLGFLANLLLAAWGPSSRPRVEAHASHGSGAPPGPSLVGVGSVVVSFVLSVLAILQAVRAPDHTLVERLWTWIPAAGTSLGATPFTVEWSFAVDPLSAVMLMVVTFVGLLIHIYSVGYMGSDPGYARFMAYLNLFMFAMLTLVLAANYLVLFVGWEGVGLCSYLLIGYWFEKKSAADAGKKAFIVNRIGDAGFLLGVFLIFTTFGTLDFRAVMAGVESMPVEHHGGTLTAIALLLFLGACGKSAQIPLYVWLPDAMEGPTPVSALIHAATMVTAGVYMVARSATLYAHAPKALVVVAIVGAFTALVASTIALVQNDIKRVLAYSTVSQLGYMFLACGVGAFAAGIFHLATHAFFKALLFLAAGSVIHGLSGEQDMRRMGGLRSRMPWTHATMLIGCLAIAGVPPLAGFFSKDEILWSAFGVAGHGRFVWWVGMLTAGLTAFYMFRLYAMTFASSFRGSHDAGHAHESPLSMRVPLVVLAVGSCVAGFLWVPAAFGGAKRFETWLEGVFEGARLATPAAAEAAHTGSAELGVIAASVVVAAVGIAVAWAFYVRRLELPARLAAAVPALYRALAGKYFVDELYEAVFVRGMALGGGRAFHAVDRYVVDGGDGDVRRGAGVNGLAWLARDVVARASNLWDRYVVDGAVNLTGTAAENASYVARAMQNGLVQHYAWLMLVGVFALVLVGRWILGLP